MHVVTCLRTTCHTPFSTTTIGDRGGAIKPDLMQNSCSESTFLSSFFCVILKSCILFRDCSVLFSVSCYINCSPIDSLFSNWSSINTTKIVIVVLSTDPYYFIIRTRLLDKRTNFEFKLDFGYLPIFNTNLV